MSHDWFRLHNDFINDPKMKRYFAKSERLDWVNFLCLSSEGKQRGVVTLPADEIAYALDLEDEEWGALLQKFIDRRMVEVRDDGAIVILHWADRQYDKPSDAPEATAERARRSRANAKDKEDVTPCHAESRDISRGRGRGRQEAETETEPGPPTPQDGTFSEVIASRPDLASAVEDRFARAESRYRSRGQSVNSPEKLRLTILRELIAKTPPPTPGQKPRPPVRVRPSEIDAWLEDQDRADAAARASTDAEPHECLLRPTPKAPLPEPEDASGNESEVAS